jgi:hypothetical protein
MATTINPYSLDRARAAAASDCSATTTTTGDEPLIVDLLPPGSMVGKHSLLWAVTFVATLTTRAPDSRGTPPASGIFMCPMGTPSENITEATAGIKLAARPIMLPLTDPYLNVANVGVTWAVVMTMGSGFLQTLPANWFLRAILNCQQGTATPGPGALSFGRLTALTTLEIDAEPC